ncbi:MAG: hypothetical protein HY708_00670 [Ignavibacteriae bacterium]|nr:hypothetical protein [Ignavibacteriota bacterium]
MIQKIRLKVLYLSRALLIGVWGAAPAWAQENPNEEIIFPVYADRLLMLGLVVVLIGGMIVLLNVRRRQADRTSGIS